jgi:hypothetical protein
MRILIVIFIVLQFSVICYSQKNKNIIVAPNDTMYFRLCKEFNNQHDLKDVTKTNDSVYIRFTKSYLETGNKSIFELKKTNGKWYGRFIGIGKAYYPRFVVRFVLFNKYHHRFGKKTKYIDFKYQLKFDANGFIAYYDTSEDSVITETIAQILFHLKSLSELDSSTYNTKVDTIPYIVNDELEMAYADKYKYLYWPNLQKRSGNYDLDFINEFDDSILLLYIDSHKRFKYRNYKKNHWPKH